MGRLEDLVTLESAGQLPEQFQKDLDTLRAAGQAPPKPAPQQESSTFTKTATPEPVLREQPSKFEEMTQPGGIASAENLGLLAGGTAGALAGSAIMPGAGTYLGGVLGAGGGAAAGRGWEMILEKLYGPYRTAGTEPLEDPKRPLGNVISELGEASQRGMVAQSVGEGLGGIVKGVGKKILGPSVAKMTPEAIRSAEVAKEHGIDVTAGETLGGGFGSRLEGAASKGITGASRAKEFGERRQEQIASAVSGYANKLSPTQPTDLSSVGQVVQAHAEGRLNGLAKASKTLISQVAGGSPVGAQQAGETVQQAKERLFDSLMEEAGGLYDKVKQAAGPAANSISAPSFQKIANEIVSKESKLTGVQVPSAKVAQGAVNAMARQERNVPGVTFGGDKIDPASLPAELIQKFGLDKNKVWDLDSLREWQSRLGQLYSTAQNRLARRDLARMFTAVSDDIKNWGNETNPEINRALKEANEFYKTRIADIYYNRLVAKIDTVDTDTVAKLFIRPQGSTVMMDRVKQAIGQEAWKQVAGSYLDDVMDRAVVNGRFSPTKALAELDKHSPEVLQKLFGTQLTAEQGLVKMMQRNPTKMINAILDSPADKVVEMLVPKAGSIDSLRTLKMLLPSQDYDRMAGAVMNNIVQKSYNSRGSFSLDLFLTQVNSRTGYTQPQLRMLLGDQYGSFRELVDLVSRMRKTQAFSENPSGTGLTAITFGQIGGGILLATDVAKKTYEGKETPGEMFTQVGEGLALASPALIGKLVYSKGGIKWLTEGLKAPPGSATAVNAISRVAAILASPKLGISPSVKPYSSQSNVNNPMTMSQGKETPSSESSPPVSDTASKIAMVKNAIRSTMQSQKTTGRDKISDKIEGNESVDDILRSGGASAKDVRDALKEAQ